jgi:hypothetical protein
MDQLLADVLDAHGGLDRWRRSTQLTVELSVGGFFWEARGWPDIAESHTATLDPTLQRIVVDRSPAAKWRAQLLADPARILIQTDDGEAIDERAAAELKFPDNFDILTTPWTGLQVSYFTASALWNYLTEPFLFTYPGFEAHEIGPWQEGQEEWRRLAVTFPDTIATHNRTQVFYYDQHLMQRRMDYAPDVAGGAPVAHYTHDPQTFDGLIFPTRRLVHLRGPDGIADQTIAAITIDISDVTIL